MRKKTLAFVLALSALLVVATVVVAVYTGPNRQTYQRGVRTIYDERTTPHTQVCRCAYTRDADNPEGRCADNDYNCHCSEYDPPNYPDAWFSCYESEVDVTDQPASASGNFACSLMGNAGWCRNGASLNVSGSEPVSGKTITRIEGNYDGSVNPSVSCNGASCSFTPPQGQGTFYYWAVSSYGDTSTMENMTYKVDTVAPSVNVTLPTPDGQNLWYVSNVSVGATGSDASPGSGLGGTQVRINGGAWTVPPVTISTDGVFTVDARSYDVAGNYSSIVTRTVRRDTLPPNVYAQVNNGVEGDNNWYVTPVEVGVYAGDMTSGVSVKTIDGVLGPLNLGEGVHTLSLYAEDYAGNSTSATQTIRVDLTDPVINASVIPTTTYNGWYTGPVTFGGSADDALSGLRYLHVYDNGQIRFLPFVVNEEGSHTILYRARDYAGRESSRTFNVSLDLNPPDFTLELSGTPGSNGWYVSQVTASVNATDSISGIASATINGEISPIFSDGVHDLYVRAEDRAGHVKEENYTLKVDTVAPVISPDIPLPTGSNGWHTSSVPINASTTDNLSGVEMVQVQIDGGAWVALPQTITSDGVHTLRFMARDEAGNVSYANQTLMVDMTPPVISPSVPLPDGDSGWFITSPVVDASAIDLTSGLDALQVRINNGVWQSLPVSLSEGVHTFDIRAVDRAGNVTSQSFSANVDLTSPLSYIHLFGVPGNGGWWKSNVSVSLTAQDDISGIREARYRVLNDTWHPARETISLSDGIYTLEVEVSDNAGHAMYDSYNVQVDTTKPLGTIIAPYTPGVDAITLSGIAQDALSGIAKARLSVNGGRTWQDLTVQNDEWSYNWSGLLALTGNQEIVLSLEDNAGNIFVTKYNITITNREPLANISDQWIVWQSGQIEINPGDLPVLRTCVEVLDPANPDNTYKQCWDGDNYPDSFKWDGIFSNGIRAVPGAYKVILKVWDLLLQMDMDEGYILIPDAKKPVPVISVPLPPIENEPLPPYSRAVPSAPPAERPAPVSDLPKTSVQTGNPLQPVPQVVKRISLLLVALAFFLGVLLALLNGYALDRRYLAYHHMASSLNKIAQYRKEISRYFDEKE